MFEKKDIQLLKEMSKAINYYLKAAGYLSDKAFIELSKCKGLYWSELEEQKEIIDNLIDKNKCQDTEGAESVTNTEEGEKKENIKPNENPNNKENERVKENEEKIKESIKNNENLVNKGNEESIENSENAPIMLYDSMVKYLKKQNIIERQWVKVYYIKHPQQDSKDFEIKYYEHIDPYAARKNYILFGDTTKNYSIRKENGEIIGDTEKCFNYILNFRDELGLE